MKRQTRKDESTNDDPAAPVTPSRAVLPHLKRNKRKDSRSEELLKKRDMFPNTMPPIYVNDVMDLSVKYRAFIARFDFLSDKYPNAKEENEMGFLLDAAKECMLCGEFMRTGQTALAVTAALNVGVAFHRLLGDWQLDKVESDRKEGSKNARQACSDNIYNEGLRIYNNCIQKGVPPEDLKRKMKIAWQEARSKLSEKGIEGRVTRFFKRKNLTTVT